MNRTLPLAAAIFAVAALTFSGAPRASLCMENGAVVACPPDAQLSGQQQAVLPNGTQPAPQELNPNQFRPSEVAPDRYPGPALSNDGGDQE
jgi:hypothetical protein